MVIPTVPSAITFTNIRNEFYAQTAPNPSNFGTSNTDLYNLNFYRGKHHFTTGTYTAFSSGALGFSDFSGKYANCNCDCDCACVCDCGDGGGDGG